MNTPGWEPPGRRPVGNQADEPDRPPHFLTDPVRDATIVPLARLGVITDGIVEIRPLAGRVEHDGVGTMFVVTVGRAAVEVATGVQRIPTCGYAVIPHSGSVRGRFGLAITHRTHRGLFMLGGPVESAGRLRYIDGCSDTVLVSPLLRGDPCLNLLHLPRGIVQSDHEHPSMRVGVVLRGEGKCVLGSRCEVDLVPGTVFVLPAGVTHRFETGTSSLLLIAWHPDSDFGPTDDDHPMLNRTLRPGTLERVR